MIHWKFWWYSAINCLQLDQFQKNRQIKALIRLFCCQTRFIWQTRAISKKFVKSLQVICHLVSAKVLNPSLCLNRTDFNLQPLERIHYQFWISAKFLLPCESFLEEKDEFLCPSGQYKVYDFQKIVPVNNQLFQDLHYSSQWHYQQKQHPDQVQTCFATNIGLGWPGLFRDMNSFLLHVFDFDTIFHTDPEGKIEGGLHLATVIWKKKDRLSSKNVIGPIQNYLTLRWSCCQDPDEPTAKQYL